MDGDRVIAKILKAEGVEWISCFPHQPLIDAVTHEGIRPILTRQERAGVNMADGFSRIKNGRSIGVFTMQEGPGAENAFAGVAQAYADSVPVLMLPGGIARFKRGVHPNFEAASNYVGVTKWAANINLVSRIPELMGHAFSQLKHGRPGPVLIEMPSDVGSETYPHDHLDYEPVVRRLSAGDSDDVRELVSALLKASNPMIHAGQGVMYAEATDELVEFAELTHIPVATTLAGKSAFPEDHRLSLGYGREHRDGYGPPLPGQDRLCTRHGHELHGVQLHLGDSGGCDYGAGDQLCRGLEQAGPPSPWSGGRRQARPSPDDRGGQASAG